MENMLISSGKVKPRPLVLITSVNCEQYVNRLWITLLAKSLLINAMSILINISTLLIIITIYINKGD